MEELLSKVVVFIAIFAMALWYAATLVAVFLSIYYDNQKEEKDPQGGGELILDVKQMVVFHHEECDAQMLITFPDRYKRIKASQYLESLILPKQDPQGGGK